MLLQRRRAKYDEPKKELTPKTPSLNDLSEDQKYVLAAFDANGFLENKKLGDTIPLELLLKNGIYENKSYKKRFDTQEVEKLLPYVKAWLHPVNAAFRDKYKKEFNTWITTDPRKYDAATVAMNIGLKQGSNNLESTNTFLRSFTHDPEDIKKQQQKNDRDNAILNSGDLKWYDKRNLAQGVVSWASNPYSLPDLLLSVSPKGRALKFIGKNAALAGGTNAIQTGMEEAGRTNDVSRIASHSALSGAIGAGIGGGIAALLISPSLVKNYTSELANKIAKPKQENVSREQANPKDMQENVQQDLNNAQPKDFSTTYIPNTENEVVQEIIRNKMHSLQTQGLQSDNALKPVYQNQIVSLKQQQKDIEKHLLQKFNDHNELIAKSIEYADINIQNSKNKNLHSLSYLPLTNEIQKTHAMLNDGMSFVNKDNRLAGYGLLQMLKTTKLSKKRGDVPFDVLMKDKKLEESFSKETISIARHAYDTNELSLLEDHFRKKMTDAFLSLNHFEDFKFSQNSFLKNIPHQVIKKENAQSYGLNEGYDLVLLDRSLLPIPASNKRFVEAYRSEEQFLKKDLLSEGLPLFANSGEIIDGVARVNALRNMSEQEYKEYAKILKEHYPSLSTKDFNEPVLIKKLLTDESDVYNTIRENTSTPTLNQRLHDYENTQGIKDDELNKLSTLQSLSKEYTDIYDSLPKNIQNTLLDNIPYLQESYNTSKLKGTSDINEIIPQALLKSLNEIDIAKSIKDLELKQNTTRAVIKEFGTNYSQYYRQEAKAIEQVLKQKEGQVAGAYYRSDLGDIDIVWGDSKVGLKKIIAKHSSRGEFKDFGKDELGVINGIDSIIKHGTLIQKDDVNTLWLKNNDKYYKVGLSKGFHNKGDNIWVITAYQQTNGVSDEIKRVVSTDLAPIEFNKLKQTSNPTINGNDESLSAYTGFNGLQTPNPTTSQVDVSTSPNTNKIFLTKQEINNLASDVLSQMIRKEKFDFDTLTPNANNLEFVIAKAHQIEYPLPEKIYEFSYKIDNIKEIENTKAVHVNTKLEEKYDSPRRGDKDDDIPGQDGGSTSTRSNTQGNNKQNASDEEFRNPSLFSESGLRKDGSEGGGNINGGSHAGLPLSSASPSTGGTLTGATHKVSIPPTNKGGEGNNSNASIPLQSKAREGSTVSQDNKLHKQSTNEHANTQIIADNKAATDTTRQDADAGLKNAIDFEHTKAHANKVMREMLGIEKPFGDTHNIVSFHNSNIKGVTKIDLSADFGINQTKINDISRADFYQLIGTREIKGAPIFHDDSNLRIVNNKIGTPDYLNKTLEDLNNVPLKTLQAIQESGGTIYTHGKKGVYAKFSNEEQLRNFIEEIGIIKPSFRNNVDSVLQTVARGFEDKIHGLAKGFDNIIENAPSLLKKEGKLPRLTTFNQAQQAVIDMHKETRVVFAAGKELSENAMRMMAHLDREQVEKLVLKLDGHKSMRDVPLEGDLKNIYQSLHEQIKINQELLVNEGLLKYENAKEFYVSHSLYKEAEKEMKFAGFKKVKSRNAKFDLAKALPEIKEIDDVRLIVARTLRNQINQLALGNTFKRVASNTEVCLKRGFDEYVEKSGVNRNAEWAMTKARQDFEDTFVLVPDIEVGGGLKQWGALSGTYLTKDVYRTLNDLFDFTQLARADLSATQAGVRMWQGVVTHLKVNTVVKNVTSHIYNVASNLIMSYFSGRLGALKNAIHMKFAQPEKFNHYVKMLRREGLDTQLDLIHMNGDYSMRNTSMNGILAKILEGGAKGVAKRVFKNLYMSEDSYLGAQMRKAYEFEDVFFKVATAIEEIEKNGATPSQALKIANDIYIDYTSPLPGVLHGLDKMGFVPFMQFYFKTIPTTYKAITKDPEAFAKYMAFVGFAHIFGFGYFSSEDSLKPDWASSNFSMSMVANWARVPGADDLYINASRAMPGLSIGGVDVGGFASTLWNIISGETSKGFDIWNKYDSPLEITAKIIMESADAFLPKTTYRGSGAEFLLSSFADKVLKSSTGEERTYAETLLNLIGLRHFNESKELQGRYTAIQNHYRKKIQNSQSPEKTQRLIEKRDELLDEIKQIALELNLQYKKQKAEKTPKNWWKFDTNAI